MRPTPQTYARAFLNAARDGVESQTLTRNFIKAIRKNGDWSERAKIIKAVEREWRKENNRPLVTVEVARDVPEAHTQKLKTLLAARGYDVRIVITPELVAGVRLTINGERQLDVSLARLIQKLFAAQQRL